MKNIILFYFNRMKLYPAMQSIREYVDKPYHRLIPDDQHPSTRPAICSGTDAATSSPVKLHINYQF